MNSKKAYMCLRSFGIVHSHVKDLSVVRKNFRYTDIHSADAVAIQACARSALAKSNLSRQLDLKTKCGTATAKDVEMERELLKRLAESKEPETDQQFEADALELMNFWQSLRERANTCG